MEEQTFESYALERVVECLNTIESEKNDADKLQEVEEVLTGLMMDIEDAQLRASAFSKD